MSTFQHISASDIDDIFNTKYVESETKYDMDPLVLSVAAKDLSDDGVNGYFNLNDLRVKSHVQPQHVELAETIRKYFTKKFFWNNLAGVRPLSNFRQRVCYLLENRITVCKDKDNGLYYKLPYFYDEDMIYDEFKKHYTTSGIPRPQRDYTQPRTKTILSLTYLKNTVSKQGRRNVQRFWFTDGTYLYCIEILKDNPLLDLFKQTVLDKLTVSLETYYNTNRIDQLEFYHLHNFSIAKETNA